MKIDYLKASVNCLALGWAGNLGVAFSLDTWHDKIKGECT